MPITNPIKKVKEIIDTALGSEKKDISIDESDKTTLKKLKNRIDEAEKIHKQKINYWENNLKFFDGDHWSVAKVSLPTYKANIVINKYFAAVRSLVAIETDAKPDPEVEANVEPDTKNIEKIIKAAAKVESELDYLWDINEIPIKLTEIYFDRYIFDDGWGWYFWNFEKDDVDFEQLKPQEIMFAPGATSVDDAEYVIIKKWRNKKWFKKYFPDFIDKIKFTGIEETSPITNLKIVQGRENYALVYHYFEDDVWVIATKEEILDKSQNRFWEWRTEEEQRDEYKEKFEAELPPFWKPVRNHLRKPEKPIIQFKGYHLGGELYSRSLLKQAKGLNIAINKRKCQIQDNADAIGNPQRILDPSVPKEMADLITSEPGLKIRINPALYQQFPGTPLPQFIFDDLLHSEQKFDDIVGHHEISRGAKFRKQTAREAILLREADITPSRLLYRNAEAAMTRILNGWVQLMKLFYNEPHYIGKFGSSFSREAAGEFLIRDEIPDNLSIMIKVGSTLPVSRETKRAEWLQLVARGLMDLVTFYELMGYPNPEKIARRVLNWRMGVIGEQEVMPMPIKPPTKESLGGLRGATE